MILRWRVVKRQYPRTYRYSSRWSTRNTTRTVKVPTPVLSVRISDKSYYGTSGYCLVRCLGNCAVPESFIFFLGVLSRDSWNFERKGVSIPRAIFRRQSNTSSFSPIPPSSRFSRKLKEEPGLKTFYGGWGKGLEGWRVQSQKLTELDCKELSLREFLPSSRSLGRSDHLQIPYLRDQPVKEILLCYLLRWTEYGWVRDSRINRIIWPPFTPTFPHPLGL